MRLIKLIMIIMVIGGINLQGEDWDVKLRILNPEIYPYEPLIYEITIENNTNKDLPYLSDTIINQLNLSFDGRKCHYCMTPLLCPKDSDSVGKQAKPSIMTKPPGYKEKATADFDYCGCIGEDKIENLEYGEHILCYHFSVDLNREIKACDKIYIKKPEGKEQEAYELMKKSLFIVYEDGAKVLRFLDDAPGATYQILKRYPGSIYSIWTYYEHMWTPSIFQGYLIWDAKNNILISSYRKMEDSIKEAMQIAKGEYYMINHMPDPANPEADRDGWIGFSMGKYKESAAYYKEKAQLILKYHPDFIFADQVRLGLAIAEIALGNESEGIKQIQDLLQEKQKEAIQQNKEISFEGKWAEEFLKQWFLQKH